MANKTTKIEYMKKKDINFTDDNTSAKAKSALARAGNEDNLIVKISINSPVFIEDVAPLTKEGIMSICREE